MITKGALSLGALSIAGGEILSTTGEALSQTPAKFNHRGYLGWITDLASEPDRSAAWPSMRLDARLLDDYEKSFTAMRRLGFNEISIWTLCFQGVAAGHNRLRDT